MKTSYERVFINGDDTGWRLTCSVRRLGNDMKCGGGETIFATDLHKIGSIETQLICTYFTSCTPALTKTIENGGRRKRPDTYNL